MIKNFLYPEGHQHCITGSKVTAILLKGWILPIGGVASGRVCACSLRSMLVSNSQDSSFNYTGKPPDSHDSTYYTDDSPEHPDFTHDSLNSPACDSVKPLDYPANSVDLTLLLTIQPPRCEQKGCSTKNLELMARHISISTIFVSFCPHEPLSFVFFIINLAGIMYSSGPEHSQYYG